MVSLADLPLEITSRIADNLESPDTNALALTCRALQVAAEPYIWEAVLLDPNADGSGGSDGDGDADADDVDGYRKVSAPFGDTIVQYETSVAALAHRYTEVLDAFAARPERAKAVKTLILSIVPGVSAQARDVMDQTLKTVEGLTMEGRHSGLYRQQEDRAHAEFYRSIEGLVPFKRLRYLAASFSQDWEGQIDVISRLGPKVDSLELLPMAGGYEGHDRVDGEAVAPEGPDAQHGDKMVEDRAGRGDSEEQGWATLPHLRTLTFRLLERTPRVFIPRVLEWAGKITKLEISCQLVLWMHDEEDQPMIKAMRNHETIEHLVWCTENWQSAAAIPRLFDGSEGWDRLHILEVRGGVEMESETYVENIHIPQANHLERLIIPCRTAAWYRHVRPPDWGKAPPPRTGLIVSSLIRQLRLCPKLDTVLFSVYAHDPELDPRKWCAKRINGVLIRSYSSPNGDDEFVHFRRLELLKVNPDLYADYDADELDECDGKDHRWTDHTSYKGCVVLPDVLDKVYKELGGEGRQWITPGRGLELPDKAWRILQRGLSRAKRVVA